MSPLPFSELTNEIFDLTSDTTAAMRETGDTWTLVLGVVVTLLPKIIPRMMPALVGENALRERFDDEDYSIKLEHMFREKFIQNLDVIENLIRAWKDDTLDLGDFGIAGDFISNKQDLITGEPEDFQSELLNGISFLQERIQRSETESDHISRIANRIWDTAQALAHVVHGYFQL